jgi:glycerol-3-phosphate dehydrogenase
VSRPFNAVGRRRAIELLGHIDYDLVVVGGGITGAGVARDAAMRGLRVALFERGDFASGTSSGSSKLLHGGIRYLEQLEFHLVWEALSERATLAQLVPHLSRAVPFLFPLYTDHSVGPLKLDLGLWLYDILAGFRNIGLHRRLGRRAMREVEPRLRPDGLRGGSLYYDAVTDDARLTLENARSAWEHGADVLPYVEVLEVIEEGGRIRGVRVRDVGLPTAPPVRVRARCVINATGPWSDVFRSQAGLSTALVRPTKGVHVMLPRRLFPADHAVVMTSPRDHRILFVIPWGTLSIVGTTDTDFDPRDGAPRADAADVRYILEILRHYFPEVEVRPEHILSAFAGLRPLYHEEGAPSSVSREHHIVEERPGFITVVGGKLTTFRLMARDLVDLALRVLGRQGGLSAGPCRTADEPLVTRLDDASEPPSGLPPEVFAHLCAVYGPRAVQVGSVARRGGAAMAERLTAEASDIVAQAVYGFEHEMALHLEDVLSRRTHALYGGIDAAGAARVIELISPALGWSAARRAEELERLEPALDAAHPPVEDVFSAAE